MTTSDENQTTTAASEPTSFWHRKPTLLIGGGLAVAALLAGGIGIGSAIADGDDDADDRSATSQPVENDADEAGDVAPTSADPGAPGYGVTDAAALNAILASAADESAGTPTSMEANRNGSWSVDFEAANGDETTVLVAADGTATAVRMEPADGDDANDPAPAGKLDEASISSAIDAALAEAKGKVVGIDLDDNPNEAFSVQILTGGNTETEIDLDTSFKVTNTEVDND